MTTRLAWACALALAGFAHAQAPTAPAAKPTMVAVCGTCHQAAHANLRGYFESAAFKSGAIQLSLGTATEVLRFDPKAVRVVDDGTARPAEHLREVKKGREARIEYVEKDGVKSVQAIHFKGPIRIAPEKLVSYGEVAKLVAQGPEKGGYALIDSRPLPRFQEGTIPTAINVPYPAWDKVVGRLPADKDKLVVFFCQGVTCMMSPNSLMRAEALGYRNARVYREGWPEWTQKDYGAITPAFVKEAFVDKGIPFVLLDARPAAEAARTGFIPGAVAVPSGEVRALMIGFPGQALKAPVMVYDAGGGEAVRAARAIVASGYENVLVVTGGLEGWKAAGYALASGEPAPKVAYTPRPRPGSIAVAEFKRIAAERPADVLILDVRNRQEAKEGMIPGALLVPEEEILARLAEIPMDKLIVTHCSTGVRAEMAYHKLKEKGYKVAFLHAELDVGKDGKFVVAVN